MTWRRRSSGPPGTSPLPWGQQLGDLLTAVRERVAATPGYPLEVAGYANAVETAWMDEPTSWGFRIECQEFGRASASTHDRLAYDANCQEWGARLAAAVAELAAALAAAGDRDLAEWAAAFAGQTETVGEQAAGVPPSGKNWEWPDWLGPLAALAAVWFASDLASKWR